MHGKVVTFGEVMMRFSPPGQARFTDSSNFNVIYAGSEANVAASLAIWGQPAEHVTAFPDHDLGIAAARYLRKFGVGTDHIAYLPGRIGAYFFEGGASVRSPKIIYDRFDSCFAKAVPSSYDWKVILKGASWFHYSGITPAVSAEAAQACTDAVKTAAGMGITVSGDINYRRNLWRYGKNARDIMPELVANTNIVVAGIADFDNCVGIGGKSFAETCDKAAAAYPSIRCVATTDRETISASHNRLSGMMWTREGVVTTPVHDLLPIVDRVGGGDAFMAGLIHGFLNTFGHQRTIDFATAASALKHTIEGDVNTSSLEEVNTLMSGQNIGKLLR